MTVAELPFPDPPLADDRIRLRPWREADVPVAHRATQDPLISRFTLVPVRQTEAQLREYLAGHEPARRAGERLALVIADVGTDDLLGVIALQDLVWPARRGDIGYWVAPWARGRGTATRAVRLLAPWGLRQLALARVAILADHDNYASQRVAEAAGFTREGMLRSYDVRKSGRYDLAVFSLIAADLDA